MRKALNVPFGVSREGMPVETGQRYLVTPSTATVMIWVSLLTVMATLARAGEPASIRPARATRRVRIGLSASGQGMIRKSVKRFPERSCLNKLLRREISVPGIHYVRDRPFVPVTCVDIVKVRIKHWSGEQGRGLMAPVTFSRGQGAVVHVDDSCHLAPTTARSRVRAKRAPG